MFKKIATAISNSCDKHGFDLSEAEIDLIAKDLSRSGLFGNATMVDEVEQGEVFRWGEKEYIKLDTIAEGCLCLAKDVWFQSRFDDETNNWNISQLRGNLGIKAKEFIPDTDKLMLFDRDLTTDDGLTDYGHCCNSISMLSCDEYRKYRKFITTTDEWYWTITAQTVYRRFVRSVSSDGSMCINCTYYGDGGVRPLICLNKETLVEVQNGEDKG